VIVVSNGGKNDEEVYVSEATYLPSIGALLGGSLIAEILLHNLCPRYISWTLEFHGLANLRNGRVRNLSLKRKMDV
jgi:hypothetical protein